MPNFITNKLVLYRLNANKTSIWSAISANLPRGITCVGTKRYNNEKLLGITEEFLIILCFRITSCIPR